MTMSDVVGRLYIKKVPVQIEAIQLDKDNLFFLTNWCGGKVVVLPEPTDPTGLLVAIDLPHIRVFLGDYITRDDEGFFDRMSHQTFESTYEGS